MAIVSSTNTIGQPQKDGRSYVSELHVADDGETFSFEWLWDGKADPALVMQLRAEQINARLEVVAASQAVVNGGDVPVSYGYFRKLFTADELQGIDKVDGNLDAFGLDQKQIDQHVTELKNVQASGRVSLSDPEVRTMLDLYVSVGVLTSERADEVLGAGKAADGVAIAADMVKA